MTILLICKQFAVCSLNFLVFLLLLLYHQIFIKNQFSQLTHSDGNCYFMLTTLQTRYYGPKTGLVRLHCGPSGHVAPQVVGDRKKLFNRAFFFDQNSRFSTQHVALEVRTNFLNILGFLHTKINLLTRYFVSAVCHRT